MMILLALAPFGVTVWAGLYLWQLKPIGFTLSYVSLGMQVIWISGPAFTWDFFSGLRLGIGVDNGAFGTYILFLGSSTVGFNSDHVFGLGVNILAVFLIFVLRRARLKYNAALESSALTQTYSTNQAFSDPPNS